MKTIRMNGGFTILEMMIATLVLSILILATMRGMSVAQDTYNRGAAVSDCQAVVRRILDDVSYELYSSSIITLSPPNPNQSRYLRYQKNEGFAGGNIVWGDPRQIQVDYDGRGAFINFWEDKPPYGLIMGPEDGNPIRIARLGQTGDLTFSLAGTRMTISVTAERRDSDDRAVTSTCSTTITLRN